MFRRFLIPSKSPLVVLTLVLFLARGTRAQHLDVNANNASDVWELIYNAQNCDPKADPDGDGVPNELEALAGTNPFDARSVPRIGVFSVTTNAVRATIAGALGKRYELQASSGAFGNAPSNWVTEASLVARTNPMVMLTAPADANARFFRVMISDVDSDGDGLNDWEEYQLGTDPFSAVSKSVLGANGKPLNDYQYAISFLKLKPTAPANDRRARGLSGGHSDRHRVDG